MRTPVFVMHRALPMLRDGGRIVSMGSAATRTANSVQIGYTVSKAAWQPSPRRSSGCPGWAVGAGGGGSRPAR
ncbi:hypothetical protein [Streptomyces sp. LN549]|uniref:hypothetical protein n=1 Tax=Streptomyces sp. LN549 TaxID=3112979 RepID=UPI00371D74CB